MSRILKSVNYENRAAVPIQHQNSDPASLDASQLKSPSEPALPEPKQSIAVTETGEQPEAAIEAMLAQSQSQVEVMLTEAQAQISLWQEEARQTGYEAGFNEGRETAKAELEAALSSAQALAQEAVEAKERFLLDNQRNISNLATAIAEKIIGQELTLNPMVIDDIVRHAIASANIREACLIRLNPADQALLAPHWAATPPQPSADQWQLVADEAIQQGGCLIEVNGGAIDAQLETKLRQVTTALDEASQDS